MKASVVLSTNEAERVELLGKVFRDQIEEWLRGISESVEGGEAVMRELAMALLEFGVVIAITDDETDEDKADDFVPKMARRLFEQIRAVAPELHANRKAPA